MYTVSDILRDIDHGCMVNNMIEDKFSYRIVYFVKDRATSNRYYVDTPYGGLRKALKSIIRNNLSLTNRVVIAEITVLKERNCVCLQSRPYPFSLDEYFRKINGNGEGHNRRGNAVHGRYAVR